MLHFVTSVRRASACPCRPVVTVARQELIARSSCSWDVSLQCTLICVTYSALDGCTLVLRVATSLRADCAHAAKHDFWHLLVHTFVPAGNQVVTVASVCSLLDASAAHSHLCSHGRELSSNPNTDHHAFGPEKREPHTSEENHLKETSPARRYNLWSRCAAMISSAAVNRRSPSVPPLKSVQKGAHTPPSGDSPKCSGTMGQEFTDDRAVRGRRSAFDACQQATAEEVREQHSRSQAASACASPRATQGKSPRQRA